MNNIEQGKIARLALLKITDGFEIPELREACKVVLHHPQFVSAPGSSNKHHAYEGGLAVHTYEVTDYALRMVEMFPDASRDVVGTAAIFHDFMKVKEYKPVTANTFVKTPYRSLVCHVAGSHAEFMKAVEGKKLSEELVMRVEHAILAHHGRLEFGSPVEPELVEAYILHYADMFSVRFGAGR